MSRVIVKNLPKGLKEEKLQETFSSYGTITDCSMKYTKEGVFRKFAFIGFKTAEDAEKAIKMANKTFIDANRIQVEMAKDFGDATKPRSWSKYSRDSSAYEKMMNKLKEKQQSKDKNKEKEGKVKKKKGREEKLDELFGDLKDDPGFHEFLEAHKSRSTKTLWSNDTTAGEQTDLKGSKGKVQDQTSEDEGMDVDSHSDHEKDAEKETNTNSSSESESDMEDQDKVKPKKGKTSKVATKSSLTDLDYLKSKVTKAKLWSDSESSDSESEDDEKSQKPDKRKEESSAESDEEEESGPEKEAGSEEESGSEKEESSEEESESDVEENSEEESGSDGETEQEKVASEEVRFVIKMKGLPTNVREKQIQEFFKPLRVKTIKIPRNAKGKKTFSIATAEFHTDKDTEEAMRRSKTFIGPKKVYLYKVKKESNVAKTQEKPRPWELQKGDDGEEETIAESGRLYVRNLAYVCTEDDLNEMFGKYGPLTEVHLPVDRLTKKVKGFAFITYMMPENAVKAYTALDGTSFQGRMLHILPSKAKKEDDQETGATSFQKKKDKDQKAKAESAHNWNTLFLGANAVADAMAEKYGATKSQILDAEGRQSLGVRMALGETQIVNETRDFLIENGVALDAFSQASAARSKTVILVKNLPAGTKEGELREIFSRYGTLGRVVLPPSGVTGIVEYLEPSEARHGFRKLAYSKFQHVPLYLEWAPMNSFTESTPGGSTEGQESAEASSTSQDSEKQSNKAQIAEKSEKAKEESSSSGEEEEESEPGATLFIKNLNFETRDDAIYEKFSKCGPIKMVTIAKKKDMKNPGQFLSMGYGFVEFKKRESAQKALKQLQHTQLEGHQLELKVSNRATTVASSPRKKQDTKRKQTSTKILVRNIPFEAKVNEVRELFSVFGELKTVRLPKKLSGTGSHRGFGFVDFLTKHDAKRAFNALCHDTHLYGRRLVLEWAETDDTVDQLRHKTAQQFHDGNPRKKLRKSDILDELKLGSS